MFSRLTFMYSPENGIWRFLIDSVSVERIEACSLILHQFCGLQCLVMIKLHTIYIIVNHFLVCLPLQAMLREDPLRRSLAQQQIRLLGIRLVAAQYPRRKTLRLLLLLRLRRSLLPTRSVRGRTPLALKKSNSRQEEVDANRARCFCASTQLIVCAEVTERVVAPWEAEAEAREMP